MIPNTSTHYQTAFKVRALNPDHSPLYAIQKIIYDWLLSLPKEKKLILKSESKGGSFLSGCEWNLRDTGSYIATETVASKDFKAWAFRYVHLDAELGAGRTWHINAGVKEQNAIATFYCQVNFSWIFNDSPDKYPLPATNTPKFIRSIVDEKNGLKVFSGSEEFQLRDRPIPVSASDEKELVECIDSKKRRFAIIVFNSMDKKILKEAYDVARYLSGKAQVRVIDNDPELIENPGQRLETRKGRFRIYYPVNTSLSHAARRRWVDPLDPDYPSRRTSLISSLLRHHKLDEPDPVRDISEVRVRIHELKLEKKISELLDERADKEKLQETISLMRQDFENQKKILIRKREDEEREKDEWITQYEEKESEHKKEKARRISLESKSVRGERPDINLLPELKQYVIDLVEIVNVFSRIYKDRLLFSDEAFKSAREFKKCPIPDRAWDMLWAISTNLYDMKFGKEKSRDIEKQFRDETGFKYGKTDGSRSKADRSIRESRRIVVDGKQYDIWAHIKYGTKPPKMLRIHIAFDEELKKIVIGYVGKHMDIASTK